jgi:transposase
LRRRLEMKSENSHKPPSSDGYRKKDVRPAIPKGEKQALGGKKGHKGKILRQVEDADTVEIHLPKACEICERSIYKEESYEVIEKRQVFELPTLKLAVNEHRLGQIECCGQVQQGK